MARKETAEISEYEKQRQANIAQRDQLLKQLALDASSAGLGPKPLVKPLIKKETARKKKAPVKRVKEEILPRRTSSRLAGLTADSEVAKRKAEDEYTAAQEAARAKRQRVSGDLNLSDVVVSGKEWDKSENFFVDIVSRGARPYVRTFGETEVKETTDKELRALRERMSGLQLYDGFEPNRIKITPERIYSLGFHPTVDKPLIFAGDKMGNLGIFDASQTSASSPIKHEYIKAEKEDDGDGDDDDDPEPNITSFHLHSRTISSFQFSPSNPSHFYTSSYDSSIRLLDLTKSTSSDVYAPADPSADEPISGVEVDPESSSILYFSRLDGAFGRTDTRSPSTPDIFQLSEKKIGGFSFYPHSSHIFATASLDRFMRLWDLRKLNGKPGQQLPALLGEHESRLSVSHAAFNAAGQVATASYDDTVKIHTFQGIGEWGRGHKVSTKEMAPSAIIKHNNQTGRWVTMYVNTPFLPPHAPSPFFLFSIFHPILHHPSPSSKKKHKKKTKENSLNPPPSSLRAKWQQAPADSVQRFCIGNMNRFVDIYAANGEQLAQLGGDSVTAVPAVAEFHPRNDWVAGGTASGKLCLWM